MSQAAVFLDRDGTLIEHYEYLTDPANVRLLPGVDAALKRLRDRGFKLIMVTNQSAVARGYLTERKLKEIHDRLGQKLSEREVSLDAIYYCPYHPEGVIDRYRKDSELRKPKPGMLQLAKKEYDIDLRRSWIVGDDDRDVLTGQAVGCRTILLESFGKWGVRTGDSEPDYQAPSLQEAANLIIRYAGTGEVVDKPEVAVPKATETVDTIPGEAVEDRTPEATVESARGPVTQATAIDAPVRKGKARPRRVAPPAGDEPESEDQSELESLQTVQTVKRADPDQDVREPQMSADIWAQMLRELKQLNRTGSYTDFSVAKLLAGLAQMIVLFFVVLGFRYALAGEPRPLDVQNSLLWALLFQVMTLTFVMMHRRR